MLRLFNKEHVAVSALTDLKDYKIQYLLSGEDLVEFSLSISDIDIHLVEEEGYVRNKFNEYVIKAIDPSDNFKRFSCVVNIEDIKAKSIKSFDTSNNNITDTIRLAIAGTGWILADNNITKRRTVRVQNTNALEVLREVRKVFNIDFRFDAINKTIYVYESFGSDKGVYFSDELNLRSLSIPSDTYDYATRLYPYGKDGLNIAAINGGKEYIENYQYSNKVIEVIWEDSRYTVVESLKEDAEAKLGELSKPKRSYQASVSDLAKLNEEYSFLDFGIGDTITLLSKNEKFRDKQRIVKYIQYPYNPSQNTCELGNTTLTFEELQRENEAKNSVVDNITSDNGTVSEGAIPDISSNKIYDFETNVLKTVDFTAINAEITNLKAQDVTITGKLTAIEGEFGTIKANVATIDSLTVTHTAQINNLIATSATITQLNVTNATISNLEATVGKIDTLVNGNLSSENMQAGGITSDSLTIKNGFITNAMIADLDVSKVNAGDISTNKFKIKSDDGGIEIVGATQQFKDKNNKVRIQMGRDKNNNFTFSLFDETGSGILIDHTGIKEGAIADDLIISDMIASDAVGEKQVDYSSFSTGFNKDTNTTTLLATKIKLNNQNQTLEVAFNSLKTQADGTKSLTESHSTTIGVMQGQITTAINNTQIVKDGQTILLKDDYNRTVATVDSMQSTIGKHTTQINEATGKISSVETNVNTISRDLEGTKSTVSSHSTQISGLNSTVSTQGSDISQLKTQITLKVEQTDITNAINSIDIGGRNLLKGTKDMSGNTSSSNNTSEKYLGFTVATGTYSTGNYKDVCTFKTIDTPTETEYVASFYAKAQQDTTITCYFYSPNTTISAESSTGQKSTSTDGAIKVNVTNEWKRYWIKWKQTATTLSKNVLIGRITSGTLSIAGVMFNVGNKANDWSPAPVDLSSEVDTKITTAKAEIKIETDKISSNVSTAQTTANNAMSKASSVEQTASQIQQTVTKIDGEYVSQSQITILDNSWTAKFKSTGYNLLRNSSFKKEMDYWGTSGSTSDGTISILDYTSHFAFKDENVKTVQIFMQNKNNKEFGIKQVVNLVPNTVYTIDFYAGGQDCGWGSLILEKNGTVEHVLHFNPLENGGGFNKWVKVEFPFTATTETYTIKVALRDAGANGHMWIAKPNLVEGYSKLWTQNPNEIYDGIIRLDKDGMTISHTGKSKGVYDSEGVTYYNSSGVKTSAIRDGKFSTIDDNGAVIGFTGKSIWKGTNTFLTALEASYGSTVGMSAQINGNGEFTTPLVVSSRGMLIGDTWLQQGLNIINPRTFGKQTFFRRNIGIESVTMEQYAGDDDLGYIVGSEGINMGVIHDNKSSIGFCIEKNLDYWTKCLVQVHTDLNMNNFYILNFKTKSSLVDMHSLCNDIEIDEEKQTVNMDISKVTYRLHEENIELKEDNKIFKHQQLLQDDNISLTEDAVNCILMGVMSTYSNKRNGGVSTMASYLGSQIYKGKLEYDEVISKYPDLKTEIDSYLETKLKNDGVKFK